MSLSAMIPSLLESTRQAVTAAAVGDLPALEAALDARSTALGGANPEDIPAAERLAAFKEGETLHFLLSGLRRQMLQQQTTLQQMKTRLEHSGPPRVALLDIEA
jgi:hypothetical protein